MRKGTFFSHVNYIAIVVRNCKIDYNLNLKLLDLKLPPIKQINHPNCFKRQIDKMTIIMTNQM